MIPQTSFTTQYSFMLVCLLTCSHGRTLQRPRETYCLYIYIEREREKERKETERRIDTETSIERRKGIHHIIAIM